MDRGLRSTMISVFVTAGVIYVAVVAFMYVFQRNMVFYPASPKPTRVQSRVADMKEVPITTEDGLDLFAWYAPAKDPAKPTVVIFHGNAGTLGDRGYKARMFLDAGFGAMLVEYRGYSGNSGKPTEQGLYADARAALGYLRSQGVEGDRTVLYGESLGTGVATTMAWEAQQSHSPVAGLMLEAPFTSIVEVAASHYPFLPVGILMKDRFNSRKRIGGVYAPLLIVHGEKDRTVPVKFGKRLFDAANAPKESMWIADASHNDLFDYGAGDQMLNFLARHFAPTPQ